jgi:hypothetical protein
VTLYRGEWLQLVPNETNRLRWRFNIVSYASRQNSQLYSLVFVYWLWPSDCFPSGKGVEVVTSAMIGSSPVLDSEVSGTIISLRERFEVVRRNEIRRVRGRLGNLSVDQENVVESLSRGIIEKVLQAPVEMLLTVAAASQSASILETVRKIFNLTT